MDKKLFVVLEQGNKCNTDLSIEHKNQFSDDYCDWYRLNWKNDTNDNLASFYEENIVWSEGRSLLFEKVKNQYEYYIFIDDDVKFISKTNLTVAEEIKNFLETYHPLTGTIYGDNWAWNTYKNNIENDQKDAFPIMGHYVVKYFKMILLILCSLYIFTDQKSRCGMHSILDTNFILKNVLF